jgi:hypothetical protein
MADKRYFGAKATITVGGTTITGIKEWSVTPRFDHVEDYDNESVFLGEVARIKGRVEVKLKFGKMDLTTSTFLFNILNPTGADGTTEDTNYVKSFTVVVEFTSFDGASTTTITVDEVRFDAVPFVGMLDQWNPMEISGIGKKATFVTA